MTIDYLNEEQLMAFIEYAGYFFSPKEIAFMLGLEKEQKQHFIAACFDEDSPEGGIYLREKLLSEAKIRKTVITGATNGSKDAQNLAYTFMNNLNFENEH